VEPVIPGWNTVRSPSRAALYDVPPAWTVALESALVGFESKDQKLLVIGNGSASVGRGTCGENNSLAVSVVRHSDQRNLGEASTMEAQNWAYVAYRSPDDRPPTLRTGRPQTITTLSGQRASLVRVSATTAGPVNSCGGTQGAVYALSAGGFTGQLGPTVILVIVADTGLPNAVPEGEIRQILTTLRPEK